MTEATEHAIENAKGWMQNIKEMVDGLAELEEGTSETVTIDGEVFEAADDVRQRIEESPLSLQVRGGWHSVGETSDPEEFEILLTTGGPALRVIGDLNQYNNPENPRLQYQDWGIPWTEYSLSENETMILQSFCQQFYFGE